VSKGVRRLVIKIGQSTLVSSTATAGTAISVTGRRFETKAVVEVGPTSATIGIPVALAVAGAGKSRFQNVARARTSAASIGTCVLGDPFLNAHASLESNVPAHVTRGTFGILGNDFDRQVRRGKRSLTTFKSPIFSDNHMISLAMVSLSCVGQIVTFIMIRTAKATHSFAFG